MYTCKTVAELKTKMRAALVLDEDAIAYAIGNYRCSDGRLVFLSRDTRIEHIGRVYVTVEGDDGDEIKIKPDPDERDLFGTEFTIDV